MRNQPSGPMSPEDSAELEMQRARAKALRGGKKKRGAPSKRTISGEFPAVQGDEK